jgi:serine/threonine protein kinase
MTEHLPEEITACLNDLDLHYSDFERVERGGTGYLWFAKNKISQARVAIKFYAGESGDRRHDEPKLLCQLQSPNILPIHDARNVSEDWAYFITPRCAGGDLDDLIESQPSVHECVDIVLGVSHGVSAIHAQGMVHRDLKPGNIVMDGGLPRIADFGTVRILDPDLSVTTASQHSPLYRPPETWGNNSYTRAGDVYQLGLVAYQLLGGRVHYDGRNYLSAAQRKTYEAIEDTVDQSLFVDAAIRSKAENGTLADLSSLPPWITPAAKKALRAMLHPTPEERLRSMADVTAAMHKLRGDTDNWSFQGDVARLEKSGKLLELRPTGSLSYEAFQQKTGSFRRVPGMQPGTLAALVRSCSCL